MLLLDGSVTIVFTMNSTLGSWYKSQKKQTNLIL